ncbi:family 43 glycosylhydrolase [Glycomyces rhizosphaerae]|uniref:Family 43 glycosylhydrolase n=1 Tax=Glycomyces rhizosphaerae TaxID=2054422 RepID=A0ABV7Q853_9ACTN
MQRRTFMAAFAVLCLAAGTAQPALAETAPADGLVAAYDFSETAGTTLYDVSGNGRDAALVGGGAWGAGALAFTGPNYVDLPDDLLKGRDSATIVVETAPDAATLTGNNFLWNIGGLATTSPAKGQWFAHPPRPGTQIGLSGNTGATVANSTTKLKAGAWQSVTATIAKNADTTTSTLAFYVDGVQQVSVQTSNNLASIADHTANFIAKSAWNDPNFRGRISSFRVYDRALSAAEVAQASAADAGEVAGETLGALGTVSLARSVAALPTGGGTVTWSSSSPAVVVRADGVTADVSLPTDQDEQVLLTATATVRGQSVTREIEATLVAVSPERSFALPAKVSGDLPSSTRSRAISWSFSVPGIVAQDGVVTRPAETVAGTLTAEIEGADPVSAEVEILDDGGSIASFVKTGAGDLLAYPDDRRSDALYVAARAEDDETWTALNRNQAILYVTWDGTQSAAPNNQMGSPTLFRAADGSLGAVASQNDAGTGIYVWDGDGRTFANQRLIRIAESGVVRDPSIVWDAAAQVYKVFWSDASGAGFVSELADLAAGAAPSATFDADPVADTPSGALPEGALAAQASELSLSAAEFDAFTKTYRGLQNTGVEPIAVEVSGGDQLTADDLPQATMAYNDGSTKNLDVAWNADELAAVDTSTPGEYTVTGTVQQSSYDFPFIAGRADPHVFYNADDGHYYATGSHYTEPWDGEIVQATSYRNIGIRRAATIEGLATAPEHVIVDPDNVAGHTYGYSGFIWAPEFHKINGTWYILVGVNRGWSQGGSFPDVTVLIPFTGSEQDVSDGKMLDAAYWGTPIELPGVAAFDVTYFEQDGQGYYLIPSAATIRVVKAQMGEGVVPQTTGATTTIYGCSKPFHYGKQEGSYSSTNEGVDQCVVEGPYVVEHDGRIYLTYSGATVDKYYTLGLLQADANADIMDPASWTARDYPLLTSYDTVDGSIGGAAHVGGGHNSFVVDEAGNLALVYHARPYPDPHAGQAGAGGLYDPDRQTAVKSVNVRADGTLDLAVTAEQEVAPEHRTVTAVVTVKAPEVAVAATVSTRCVAGKVSLVVTARNTDAVAADIDIASVFGTKTFAAVAPGKSVSIAFATRSASVAPGDVTVSATADGRVGSEVAAHYGEHTCG